MFNLNDSDLSWILTILRMVVCLPLLVVTAANSWTLRLLRLVLKQIIHRRICEYMFNDLSRTRGYYNNDPADIDTRYPHYPPPGYAPNHSPSYLPQAPNRHDLPYVTMICHWYLWFHAIPSGWINDFTVFTWGSMANLALRLPVAIKDIHLQRLQFCEYCSINDNDLSRISIFAILIVHTRIDL